MFSRSILHLTKWKLLELIETMVSFYCGGKRIETMTIRQFINRIICPIDYFYYNKLLRVIEREGKVPLMMVPDILKLSQKYGK